MIRCFSRLLFLNVLLLAPSVLLAQELGRWDERAAMPTARKEIANATVALAGKIYVAGGVARNGTTSRALEIYDPGTDSWTTAASLPLAVWRACAATLNDTLYVFGGYRTAQFPFSPPNRVFAYDPITDSWDEKARMSQGRGACVAITLDDGIHILGGLGGSRNADMDLHEVYKPSANTWVVEQPMPISLSGMSAALLNNTLYLMGGYRFDPGVVSQNLLLAYDVATKTWTARHPMPAARLGIDAVVLSDKIVVFGGQTTASTPSATLAYDPITDHWQQLTHMPVPVSFMGAAVVGQTVYVIGGGAVNLNRFDGLSVNRAFTMSPTPTTRDSPDTLPQLAELAPNYPNPFSHSTTLSVTLQKPSLITLTIYSLLGQPVATLLHAASLPMGTHTFPFEADILPAGTYVQTLRVTPLNTPSQTAIEHRLLTRIR